MNKKAQENGMIVVISLAIIFITIGGFFLYEDISKPGRESSVNSFNNFKLEALNLARTNVEYNGKLYTFLDLLQVYYQDKENGEIHNVLQKELDKMIVESSCYWDTSNTKYMEFPKYIKKSEFEDNIGTSVYTFTTRGSTAFFFQSTIVFQAYNPDYYIVFSTINCGNNGVMV